MTDQSPLFVRLYELDPAAVLIPLIALLAVAVGLVWNLSILVSTPNGRATSERSHPPVEPPPERSSSR